MKVEQVIIQRIGERLNVNEIKEGAVYFVDDAGVHSAKSRFKFGTKN